MSSVLLKNSSIYAFASFFQKTINFLLIPLYTIYLTTADYGLINIIFSLSSFLSILLLFSLQSAATRFHYDKETLNYPEAKIWGTVLVIISVFILITFILFLFLGEFIFNIIIPEIPYVPYVIIGIVYTLLSPVYMLYQFYLQAKQEAKKYAVNMMANFTINVLLIVFFLVVLKLKVLGILYAYLITNIIFFIYTLARFLPRISLRYNPMIGKRSLQYSLPLVPHSLAGWSMSMLDRLFINKYLGASETGIYSIGAQMSSIVNTVTGAVNQAYSPWYFQNLNQTKGSFQIANNKMVLIIVKLYFLLGIFISFFAESIVDLIASQNFQSGWVYVPILSWAYIINGIYYFQVAPLFIKNTRYIPIITLTASGLNILLFILLIPHLGGIGASFATFFAFLCSNLMATILVHKLERQLKINVGKIYKLLLVSLGISSFSYVLYLNSVLETILIRLLILTVTFLFFFRSNSKDIKNVYNLIKRKLKGNKHAS